MRIQDAGWLWSGGFALDTPGDIFVNIRHRSDSLTCALGIFLALADAVHNDAACPLCILFCNSLHSSEFCRDRGETRLVRVDICSTKGGVLVVSMSHQAGGFAPYRLDNCSTEVLHVR